MRYTLMRYDSLILQMRRFLVKESSKKCSEEDPHVAGRKTWKSGKEIRMSRIFELLEMK